MQGIPGKQILIQKKQGMKASQVSLLGGSVSIKLKGDLESGVSSGATKQEQGSYS